jgi:response regulator RpfG family c-di-GMP phosphodiesterase
MSKISVLIIDDEPEILDILEILIESEFSCNIVRSSSGNEAIKNLESDASIKLIVSDYTMGNGTGGDVFNFNKLNSNLPFLLLSGGFLQDYHDIKDFFVINDQNVFLQKPVDTEQLFNFIQLSIKEDEVGHEECMHDRFKKININHAIYFLKNNKDIFLNIGTNKFIKVINEGELHSPDEFIKYRDKGEKYLYILNEDFKSYMKEILRNIELNVKSSDSFSDTITIGVHGFEFVHSSLIEMGLSEAHVEFVNTVVNKCVTNLMKNNKVSMLLNSFFREKGYLVSHSLTSIYISYIICGYLDYAGEQVIEKLVYAGILHDLGLIDKDLSSVLECHGDEFTNLSQRDQKQVLNHSFESVKLLELFKCIPNDVENIILEHHENASGGGFPRGLSATRIAPLSAIFILSLRFSDFLFHNDFESSAEDYINKLKVDFNKGGFKKPLAGLSSSVKKALKK